MTDGADRRPVGVGPDHRPMGAGVIADSMTRPGPLGPRGLWFQRGPRGIAQSTGAFVWLAFIVFPAINAFAKHGTALDHGLTIAGAVLFVATYIALITIWRWRYADTALPILFAVLVALAVALALSDGNSWGFLFTYCAASAGLISRRFGFAAVVVCSALAGVTSALGGASGGQVIGWVASSAGIGMLILVMRDLRLRNEELNEARGELARMAVAQERERFARDLHDLLGHSLSVIALKAELAGRMLTDGREDARVTGAGRVDQDRTDQVDNLERAATEVHELEQVARTALTEVREAVSGYRQPTLSGELAGARMALSAAGIEAEVQETKVPLDPTVEAVLAWTVREGATNVIRHSGARNCTLRVSASLADVGVEVIDDGAGRQNGTAADDSAGGAAIVRGPAATVARAAGSPDAATKAAGSPDAATKAAGSPDAATKAAGSPDAATKAAGSPGATATASGPTRPGEPSPSIGGHGLAGLAERARLVNGAIEAGALPGGGYRLAVTVPVAHP